MCALHTTNRINAVKNSEAREGNHACIKFLASEEITFAKTDVY